VFSELNRCCQQNVVTKSIQEKLASLKFMFNLFKCYDQSSWRHRIVRQFLAVKSTLTDSSVFGVVVQETFQLRLA
jgi:hypothetical protein